MSAIRPSYILRSHASSVNSLHFSADKLYLASADADGFVVVWSLLTKRPIAVWKAAQVSILKVYLSQLCSKAPERSSSSGRSNTEYFKLCVTTQSRDGKVYLWELDPSQQWSTQLPIESDVTSRRQPWLIGSIESGDSGFCGMGIAEILNRDGDWTAIVATPASDISTVKLFALPNAETLSRIEKPNEQVGKSGMVTALAVIKGKEQSTTDLAHVRVVVGYESGMTVVWLHTDQSWVIIYAVSAAHSEPILSLDVVPDVSAYFTVGADRTLVKHPLQAAFDARRSKAAGDEADVIELDNTGYDKEPIRNVSTDNPAQGLSVRSDGRILATSGWDGHGYIYSCKTLKQLAILQWHRDGCYATAFSPLDIIDRGQSVATTNTGSTTQALGRASNSMAETRRRTLDQAHVLALGSKDGKISLWDIY